MLAKLIQAQGRQSCAPRAAFRARQVKRVLGATERRPQEPLQQPRWQAGVEVPTKHRCCICCEKISRFLLSQPNQTQRFLQKCSDVVPVCGGGKQIDNDPDENERPMATCLPPLK